MKYGCAHPDNGFDGSDNTKFMMGSSDCIVTWGPMVKLSVSPKAQSRPRALSQKESSYLLRMTRLCSNMLRAWSAVHMWRPSKASNIPLCHWHIKNWGSIASFSPCGREACMITWIFCRHFFFWALLKTSTFSNSIRWEKYTYMKNRLTPKSNYTQWSIVYLLWL